MYQCSQICKKKIYLFRLNCKNLSHSKIWFFLYFCSKVRTTWPYSFNFLFFYFFSLLSSSQTKHCRFFLPSNMPLVFSSWAHFFIFNQSICWFNPILSFWGTLLSSEDTRSAMDWTQLSVIYCFNYFIAIYH